MVYSWKNTYSKSNYQKTNRKIQIVRHSRGKCQCHNRQKKNQKNTLDYGRLKSHDNHMQCSILGWILDWEKITTNGVLGTVAAAAAAKLLQSRPTLCDHIDGSPQALPSLGFSRQNTGVGCHFLLQCISTPNLSSACCRLPEIHYPKCNVWVGLGIFI